MPWNVAPMNACVSSYARDASIIRPKHKHIHVVVLHALVRRIGVVANPGANPGNVVGRDAHAHSRSANENPARRYAGLDRFAHLLCKIGTVVLGLNLIRTQVDHFVACRNKVCAQILLQRKSCIDRN